jgi:hypothetical protein
MHAGVKANFFAAKGSIEAFASSHGLELTARGRGLEPKEGDAIFSNSAEEIEAHYTTEGEPVPIYVEYRSIPSGCVPANEEIKWAVPTYTTLEVQTVHFELPSSLTCVTYDLRAECELNGRPLFFGGKIIDHHYVCGRASISPVWFEEIAAVPEDRLVCRLKGTAANTGGVVSFDLPPIDYTFVDTNSDKEGSTSGTFLRIPYTLKFKDP